MNNPATTFNAIFTMLLFVTSNLVSAQVNSSLGFFDLNPVGNLLSNTDTHTARSRLVKGNRLLIQGDKKFYYDARGNLTHEIRGKESKLQKQFIYNLHNQLIKVQSHQRDHAVEFRYDPLGRRIAKQDAFGTTQFLWADNLLLQEQRNHKTTTYLYEPGSFRPLAQIQDNRVYHYHLDHLGTPRELTNTEGKIVWKARYKTYGNLALKEVEEVENNLRFQGQYYDQETGLHYNRFRYYSPDTGQFINQDPIGLLGGLNNYQYVPNPISWIDPLGLACKEITEKELPASVLDEKNFLGKGAFKEAFLIDENSVFLIPRRVVTHNMPSNIDDLIHEGDMLKKLRDIHGLSVLHIQGLGVINMADGTKMKGLIADRKLFNGKDVFNNIKPGTNAQGVTMADVRNTVTPQTLVELEKMKATVIKDNIVIEDFQLLYGKDGIPVIADPISVDAGANVSPKAVKDTVALIESNIKMVENILKSKPG